MGKKLFNSQLTTYKTYEMYKRQCITLAENVFQFDGLNDYIDISYINSILVRNGSIAFFEDEVLGLLALPYKNIGGKLDVYGRPVKITVEGVNGYRRELNRDEFVIMYDNNGRYPIWLDIIQYSERLAQDTITVDINIKQQRTPRIIRTKAEYEKSVRDLFNAVDSNVDKIITYDNIDLDETSMILAPAPYVADKLDLHKDKIWAEFLRLVGITNLAVSKKERNISDEISAMNGGTVASRYSRFEPRKRAVSEINKKFGTNISVRYYDGIPSDKEKFDEDFYKSITDTEVEESEVANNE